MNPLDWPHASLPLPTSVTLYVPFTITDASPEEAETLQPALERVLRDADPSILTIAVTVKRDVLVQDLGRTIMVHPLALQVDVQLSCEVLPQERTRRQAQLARGIMRWAMTPEAGT